MENNASARRRQPCDHYGFSVESHHMVTARFDPDKDAINRQKHRLSLAFGERIFEDIDYLIVPSIRKQDGEERFKVVGKDGG